MPHGMLSYTFSKSMNTICKSFFWSLYFSISLRKTIIASLVDHPGMKWNWFSLITVSCLIIFLSLSPTTSLYGLKFWSLYSSCILLHYLCSYTVGISVLFLHSSGLLSFCKITLKRLVNQQMSSTPKPLDTSISILSSPTTFVLPVFLRAFPTYSVVISQVDPYSRGLWPS